MTALAREGARAVSTARLAVSSYDTFIASQQGMATNALDVDVLLLYLHSVTACAKAKRVKIGKTYKGSAAQARLKGLKSAVSLLGAPFDMVALQSRFTASAVLRPETPAVKVTSAHISAKAVAAIECNPGIRIAPAEESHSPGHQFHRHQQLEGGAPDPTLGADLF